MMRWRTGTDKGGFTEGRGCMNKIIGAGTGIETYRIKEETIRYSVFNGFRKGLRSSGQ